MACHVLATLTSPTWAAFAFALVGVGAGHPQEWELLTEETGLNERDLLLLGSVDSGTPELVALEPDTENVLKGCYNLLKAIITAADEEATSEELPEYSGPILGG